MTSGVRIPMGNWLTQIQLKMSVKTDWCSAAYFNPLRLAISIICQHRTFTNRSGHTCYC